MIEVAAQQADGADGAGVVECAPRLIGMTLDSHHK
jgi:hypothetical protein